MENKEEFEEPEIKKPHLNSPKQVDAAVLQHQNQNLVQQLDIQKHEIHEIEAKMMECRDKQISYDSSLITVNQQWDQLVDDLTLLRVRAGGGPDALRALDHVDRCRGSIPSCSAEDVFLCRLLQTDFAESSCNDGIHEYVEEALESRNSSTRELMKSLEDTIKAECAKTDIIAQSLHGNCSAEDIIIVSSKFDDMLNEETKSLQEAIEVLEKKNEEYVDQISKYNSGHATDEAEIKRLKGELEENLADLEESRRKLVQLKMQKEAAAQLHNASTASTNGSLSPKKPADRSMGFQELKDAIEEVNTLSADRSSEIQDAREDNLNIVKQLENLQNELKDDKYVHSSRFYSLTNDRFQYWSSEAERYKAMIDSRQAERSFIIGREKELAGKIESVDATRNNIDKVEFDIKELELELQKCIDEKNDLEVKMEETLQDSGRPDIKAEFRVMASALSKEMEMMKAQLNRWKQTACEARSLHEKSNSLRALLNAKTSERMSLEETCAKQNEEIKRLKAVIEELQRDNTELEICLNMYGQDHGNNRSLTEIKESERRALLQAEVLRNALAENNLELRMKAAKEAEAACQRRLSAAKAEIADLREKLDASEREVLVLTEAIKIKDGEGDTYISEIETIGQAYEDMQTQNQHLLQQVTERDDYNIKLVSESVRTKNEQNKLLTEKQALTKQLQQVNASIDSLKLRIARCEEQMKVYLVEAMNSIQEDRHLAVSVEMARWELSDAEKELKLLKSALSSSEKESDHYDRKIDEIQKEIENERSEKKKVQEELMELQRELAELSSQTGEAAIQNLQDEIKSCKDILKCGVCFDRPKEVIIVKCYHLFCNPCIQRNLEIRHRKCPACGTPFGQNDVRFVKI